MQPKYKHSRQLQQKLPYINNRSISHAQVLKVSAKNNTKQNNRSYIHDITLQKIQQNSTQQSAKINQKIQQRHLPKTGSQSNKLSNYGMNPENNPLKKKSKLYQKPIITVGGSNKSSQKNLNYHRKHKKQAIGNQMDLSNKKVDLNGIMDKIINLERSRAFINKQRHLSINSNNKSEQKSNRNNRPSLPLQKRQHISYIKIHSPLAQNKNTYKSKQPKKQQKIISEDTLTDFEKSIQKNKQYIHDEINKKMSQKKNSIARIKTEGNNGQSDRIKLLQKNINKIRSYKKYAIISQGQNQAIKNSVKNLKRPRHSSGTIKNSPHVPKKKVHSQNKNISNIDNNINSVCSLQQSSIFTEISHIISKRLNKNQNNKMNCLFDVVVPNNKNQQKYRKIKQATKLEKLIQKIKSFSPQKSKKQIQQEICGELHQDYGILRAAVPYDSCGNTISANNKLILKNQSNYCDWRRISINNSDNRDLSNFIKSEKSDSFNLPNSIKSPESTKMNKSIEYHESNYDLQNKRLQHFIIKTQNSLTNYIHAKNQLNDYQCQSNPQFS